MRCEHPEFPCGYRTLRHNAEIMYICITQLQDIPQFTQVRTGTPDFDKPGAEPGEDHKVKWQPGILWYFSYQAKALCHLDRFLHRFYRWSSTGHDASPARWLKISEKFLDHCAIVRRSKRLFKEILTREGVVSNFRFLDNKSKKELYG